MRRIIYFFNISNASFTERNVRAVIINIFKQAVRTLLRQGQMKHLVLFCLNANLNGFVNSDTLSDSIIIRCLLLFILVNWQQICTKTNQYRALHSFKDVYCWQAAGMRLLCHVMVKCQNDLNPLMVLGELYIEL